MQNHDLSSRPHPNFGRGLLTCAVALALPFLAGCGNNQENTPNPPTAPSESAAARPMPAQPLPAQPTAPSGPADVAWQAFESAFQNPPPPPASWMEQPPDEAARLAFQKDRAALAEQVADLARAFYDQHPTDERASAARWHELELLNAAVGLGNTNVAARLAAREKDRLDDPATSDDERFGIRVVAAQREAEALFETDEDAGRAALEKSMTALAAEFPARPEPYQILVEMASDAPADRARSMLVPVMSTNAPEAAREAGKSLLARLDMVGKPLDLQFTATNGKEINLADYRGKVVLVDFWATWCGPCIAELPKLKEAYQLLQPRGFEILGISFDDNEQTLKTFVERESMTWPQYFDGKGWENTLGTRFGIASIPTLWLVDKQGVLRDLNARQDLVAKVENLLAEPAPAVSQ